MSGSSSSSKPSASSSNFQSIFNAALKAYEKKTKSDLLAHPLAAQLQACSSPNDIFSILQDKLNEFDQSRSRDERLSRWLNPTINILLAFSATLSEGVGLVFSPAKVIFAGVGVLLLAAKDVDSSQDTLVDLFESIENFFKRLPSYTTVRPTVAMTDIIVKIMVEVLDIFAIATKEMKQGRTKKYLKKLVGKKEMEDALKRLDRLTQEEARMAVAEALKVTHIVDGKVTTIDDKITTVDDKVTTVDNKVTTVDDKVTSVINVVDDVKWNQVRECLRKWATSPDPSTNHNIACGIQLVGTSQWFFQGSMFREWRSKSSLLWIYGKPGSGKSILCSAIIQDIMSLRKAGLASLAYFYFDFKDLDKQNRRNLLPSLLVQLSAQSSLHCDILYRLYLEHDNGSQAPSEAAMIQCLKEMLMLTDQRPIYIILDALDECPNLSGIPSPRELVVTLVKELVDLHLPYLHICVTSRPEFDIRATLSRLAHHSVSLHDQSGQKKDIIDYVTSVVYSDAETMMKRWRDEDKKMVVESLSERADGMFRWVFCQLETLRQCLPQCVRRTLNELPQTLDETYERVMMEIKRTNQAHAYRMLQCLTVAARPLSVAELAELLAFDFDRAKGGIPKFNSDWRWGDHEEAVLSTCSSLITVVPDDESPVVQFSHFSVKEFLMSDRLAMSTKDISRYYIAFEAAHTVLAQTCLSVLLRDPDIKDGADSTLARYAARHWVTHAQVEDVASSVRGGMESLFDPCKNYFKAWVSLYNNDHGFEDGNSPDQQPGARELYYAALCGFHELVEHLIHKYPQCASTCGGRLGTALHSASDAGHLRVVRSLLRHGVDIDIRDKANRTPLGHASTSGRCDVVQCLIDHGADVDSRDMSGLTPLDNATNFGHVDVIRVLLEHNSDVNVQDNDGLTPLHTAIGFHANSRGDYLQIVRLLLQQGANPNARDANRRTPLHLANSPSTLDLARVLLEYGADVDAKNDEGMTPSEVALEEGMEELAQLISEFRSGRAQT